MTQNHRKTLKKFIAFSLTAAVIAGAVGYYGEADVVNAQERTLPGIERLVKDTVDSGDTFHILEVVPSKENASIGYLIGGEEPVLKGRKLSELPSQTERTEAMSDLANRVSAYTGADGLISVSNYAESDTGSRQEDIKGKFVVRENGSGRYNFGQNTGEYRMLTSSDTTSAKKYRRDSKVTESDAAGTHPVQITMSELNGSLQMNISEGSTINPGTVTAAGQERYALKYYSYIYNGGMDVDFINLNPVNYVGNQVWIKQGAVYSYLGKVITGENIPSDYTTVTDGDAANAVADSNSLYVLDRKEKKAIPWAVYCENEGGTPYYTEHAITNGTFCYFEVNDNGDYYVSDAVYCETGDFYLADSFVEDDYGNYVKAGGDDDSLVVRGDVNFDDTKATYDFVGDDSASVYDTVTYSGGIYNQEWFKKQVLNLSGHGQYETDADTDADAEMNRLKIEVSTVTVEELASLAKAMALTDESARAAAMEAAYCGVDLSQVDLIYLSGQGSYVALGEDAQDGLTAAATILARLGFGYDLNGGTTRTAAARVPVIVDYGFYNKNKGTNEILAKLALCLLLVSNEETANAIAAQGDAFWTGNTVADLESKVNGLIKSAADAVNTANGQTLSLGVNIFEYLTENIYLNNDIANAYVAKDYLTDFSGNTSRAWIYNSVLSEIRYENFISRKDGSTQAALLPETVSKASVTRYILNWYLHRVIVKSELKVLDLEPCYDFGQDALTAVRVKELMGLGDSYQGTIEITQMASTEFIGKVEDLNASYDLIYVGDRVGNFNVDANGDTVYNDKNMNGLIYTHVGDAYDYSGESSMNQSRLKDDSLTHTQNQFDNSLGNASKAANTYRGPGNDMNSTKFEEFKQYIQAGYPVIFADKLLKGTGANPVASSEAMDTNSYFYKLVEFALSKDANGNYLYWQKNVYAEGQLKANSGSDVLAQNMQVGLTTSLEERQNTFRDYLNLSKLTLKWVTDLKETWRPEALYTTGNKTGEQYSSSLQAIDGQYRLQYIFSLSNDAALSQVSTTYDCRLFIDSNSDGRFAGSEYITGGSGSASEELTGLEIYVRDGNQWTAVAPVVTEKGSHYELNTGRTYKVCRVLPDDFVGVLPWKLVLYDNADRLVRTAVSDYTAVTRDGKQKIRILQLLSDKRNDKNGNKDKDSNNTWNLSTDKKFQEYIRDLKDYQIEVDTMYVSDLVQDIDVNPSDWNYNYTFGYMLIRERKAYEIFQQYDMLIVGFADNYQLGTDYGSGEAAETLNTKNQNFDNIPDQNMAIALAVRDYAEAGYSVLFTHDTTSYINSMDQVDQNWYWGYEINKSIRTVVGLDRYGAVQNYYTQTADKIYNQYFMPQSQRELCENYREYASHLANDYTYDTLYEPGTTTPLGQKEGLTKYTVVRFLRNQLENLRLNSADGTVKNSDGSNFYFPVRNSLLKTVGMTGGGAVDENDTSRMLQGTYALNGSTPQLRVQQVNEGQITKYPYLITDEEQEWLKVNSTHYQWLQPNMELDKDKDGKSDIVVWYTISDVHQNTDAAVNPYAGKNIYSIDPKDVVNNYYIYTMGNVTYSGAGHKTPESSTEMKLFVNTIIAAYNAGVKAPKVEFQNDSGTAIGSLYMIYDEQNHIVLRRDGENQNEIKVNFQVTDYNILSGSQTYVEFYKSCGDDNTSGITVDGITGKVIPLNVKQVRDAGGNEVTGSGNVKRYQVTNGAVYSLTYDLSEMGMFSTDASGMNLSVDAEPATIYVRTYTEFSNGSEKTPVGTATLNLSVEKLFELN